MRGEIPDSANPFRNARVVGTDYDQRLYITQKAKRGDLNFIMSRSELVDFALCPRRWRDGYKDDEGTDSTEWGSLVDCLLFHRSKLEQFFAVKPAEYPVDPDDPASEMKPWNANSKWCKEWLVKQGSKIPISREKLSEATVAVERLMEDPQVRAIALESDFQVYITAEYYDDMTGLAIPVHALLDIVPKVSLARYRNSIIDFKTAASAFPGKWGRTLNQRGYDVQGAMQIDCWNGATGDSRGEFRHIVQENFPPYAISKPLLSEEFLRLGRMNYIAALRLYAKCLKENWWPGYDDIYLENLNGWSLVHPEPYMLR